MNREKQQKILNSEKFESIMFMLDYISNLRELTGELIEEDFLDCLVSIYDTAFKAGKRAILDEYICKMYDDIVD